MMMAPAVAARAPRGGAEPFGADGAPGAWLAVVRRYLACIAVANLAWETLHLPLYTIWNEGTGE